MYAALVAEALKDVAPGPLVIVGHSFGGRIAVVLAARHPELVGALVLTGAPLVKRTATARSPFVYRLLRGLHERGLLGDRRMESVRQRFGSTDYRNATGVMRGVLVATVNESYEAELTEVLAPVSMLWGANDLDAPLASAERAASLLRCPHRLRVLAGIGHLVPSEAPHELAVAVKETLA